MKIAVTGALGHIGSQLIRRLPFTIPDSHILLIDNFSTQRYASLFNLPKEGKYKLVDGDVRYLNLEKTLDGVDVVIHLSATTDATSSFQNSALVEGNNLKSTQLICDASQKVGAKVIHLSSTSIYGTSNKSVDEKCPIDELMPQSPYAQTKLLEEDYVLLKSRQENLKAVTLRFGTIFGVSPGMRFHTAVNKFCWQACWGLPLTVWETAYDQVRPYLHLDDACSSIIHVIDRNLYGGEIYNVLTLNATVREITDEIRKHIPKLKINFVQSEIMNQLSYKVMTDKFISTGFHYSGSLTLGIKDTIRLLISRPFGDNSGVELQESA